MGGQPPTQAGELVAVGGELLAVLGLGDASVGAQDAPGTQGAGARIQAVEEVVEGTDRRQLTGRETAEDAEDGFAVQSGDLEGQAAAGALLAQEQAAEQVLGRVYGGAADVAVCGGQHRLGEVQVGEPDRAKGLGPRKQVFGGVWITPQEFGTQLFLEHVVGHERAEHGSTSRAGNGW